MGGTGQGAWAGAQLLTKGMHRGEQLVPEQERTSIHAPRCSWCAACPPSPQTHRERKAHDTTNCTGWRAEGAGESVSRGWQSATHAPCSAARVLAGHAHQQPTQCTQLTSVTALAALVTGVTLTDGVGGGHGQLEVGGGQNPDHGCGFGAEHACSEAGCGQRAWQA